MMSGNAFTAAARNGREATAEGSTDREATSADAETCENRVGTANDLMSKPRRVVIRANCPRRSFVDDRYTVASDTSEQQPSTRWRRQWVSPAMDQPTGLLTAAGSSKHHRTGRQDLTGSPVFRSSARRYGQDPATYPAQLESQLRGLSKRSLIDCDDDCDNESHGEFEPVPRAGRQDDRSCDRDPHRRRAVGRGVEENRWVAQRLGSCSASPAQLCRRSRCADVFKNVLLTGGERPEICRHNNAGRRQRSLLSFFDRRRRCQGQQAD